MSDVRTEISKREYLKYQADPAKYHQERKEDLPIQWVRGWGWYGCYCYESSNGHYYRCDRLGDSCD